MVAIGEKFPEVSVKTTQGVIKFPDYFAKKRQVVSSFQPSSRLHSGLYD